MRAQFDEPAAYRPRQTEAVKAEQTLGVVNDPYDDLFAELIGKCGPRGGRQDFALK